MRCLAGLAGNSIDRQRSARTMNKIHNNLPCRSSIPVKMTRQSGMILLAAIFFGIIINQTRPDGLPLVGYRPPIDRRSDISGKGLIISLEEAFALHASDQAIFLDARRDNLFEVGHIMGAKNIPTEHAENLIPKVLQGVSLNRAIITYCDGETCGLSHDLALVLLDKGFKNVRVLVNGWTLWLENGMPVEEGRS